MWGKILGLLRFLWLIAFVLNSRLASADPYRIGAILPLSGEVASIGNYLKKSIDLALDSLPAAQRAKLQVVYEDDGLQSAKSISAFRMLRDSKSVDSVFVVGSGVGSAVAPLAEREKTLLVALGASDKSFVAGRTYCFIHWVSPEAESAKLVAEIKERGYKRIAMLSHEQQGVVAFDNAFLAELERQGLADRVVLRHNLAIEDRDFNTFIAKARAAKVDGISVALLSGALSSFARKVRESGLKSDLFGAELFEDEHEVRASGGALVGSWFVNADVAQAEFVKKYRDRYHEHPGWATANAYDTLRLIAAAVDQFGNDNLKIASYLRAIRNYSGAAGIYSASGDNRFILPAAIKLVQADGFPKLR
ncbi:MAG: ABC transporter substrate-binding protein [Oligoflexia bacterium]|nr:ABC transporter substrate-binding protein [Oligoflexia bacterium]